MIYVYSTPTCYACKQVKEYLNSRKIKYQVVDVTKPDFDNNKFQIYGVPTIKIDGKRYYTLKELKEVYE